jgi:hypothetical protein
MRHFCDELGDNRSAERVEILGNHHKRTHTADDVVNSAMSVTLFLFDVHRPHDTSSDRNYSAADRSYDPVRLPSWPPPVATLRPLPSPLTGLPPITRTTFPACRAHYPGGSTGCSCRLLPRSYSLPQIAGGSASALSLSRPARASLALRPAGSLSRQGSTFVTRLQPSQLPDQAARQLPDQPTIVWVESSSTGDFAPSGRTAISGLLRTAKSRPVPSAFLRS